MGKFKKSNSIMNGGGSETELTKINGSGGQQPMEPDGTYGSGETQADSFEKADEFRYIKKHENKKVQGHPAHVYAKSDEQAKYMQMTHSKFIKDMAEANIGLKVNPKPGDERTAYIVPKSHISDLKDLGKVKDGWKLSELDDKTLLIYRDEPFNNKAK